MNTTSTLRKTLPMTAKHISLIRDGIKTTTLRTGRMNGSYALRIKGKLQLKVFLTPVGKFSCPITPAGRAKLAASEGYPGDEARFEAALIKLLDVRGHTTGTDYINGTRKLWLHEIKVVA